MDARTEPITDPGELAEVRTQARTVHVKSLVFAIVLTAALIVL